MGRPKKIVDEETEDSPPEGQSDHWERRRAWLKKKLDNPTEVSLETRHLIIKRAESLFIEKGYKGVSMKEVAGALEVTPAALYYHFPGGKEDLFLDIVKNMFEEWTAGLAQAVEPGQNIREKLHLLTRYFVTRPSEQATMMMRDVHIQLKDEKKKQQVWEHYGKTYVQAITAIFQEAIDRGELTPHIPAHTLAVMYQGMNVSLLNYSKFVGWRMNPVEVDRIAQSVVSVMLDGAGQKQTSDSLSPV